MKEILKLINEFFYIPKHGKVYEKVVLTRITASVVLMVICLVAMSFSAFAYFSHSASTGYITIQSAEFSLDITLGGSNAEIPNPYICLENGQYTFTLTSSGTAETGYCKIEINDGEQIYYTTQVFKTAGENRPASITLTIKANTNDKITFIPQWGTSVNYLVNQSELYGVEGRNVIDPTTAQSQSNNVSTNMYTLQENGEIIYTVVANDTLSGIALQFETTVERIVAYNGLEDPNNIQAEQQIKIPPIDWVISADTTTTVNTIVSATNNS